jgi:transcriptional antiterminator NusG
MRSHAGRKDIVTRPYIPGYGFVQCDGRGASMIRNCFGVRSVLHGASDDISDVVDGVVDEIRRREVDGFVGGMIDPTYRNTFRQGETLRVAAGPFASFNGLFECETGADRARVLVSIFGRKVKVELGLGQLEKT